MFTWGVTALGASAVIFFKEINKKVLNGMLGFAVMMSLDVALG
jgi:ZIP family zinc transporter